MPAVHHHARTPFATALRRAIVALVLLSLALALTTVPAPSASAQLAEFGAGTPTSYYEGTSTSLYGYRGIAPSQVDRVKSGLLTRPTGKACGGLEKQCDGLELAASARDAAPEGVEVVTHKDGKKRMEAGGVARVVYRVPRNVYRVEYGADFATEEKVISELRRHRGVKAGESLLDFFGKKNTVLRLVRYTGKNDAEERILVPWNLAETNAASDPVPDGVKVRATGKVTVDFVFGGYRDFRARANGDPVAGARDNLKKVKNDCAKNPKNPACKLSDADWKETQDKVKSVTESLAEGDQLAKELKKFKDTNKKVLQSATPGAAKRVFKNWMGKATTFKAVKALSKVKPDAGGFASWGVGMVLLATNYDDIVSGKIDYLDVAEVVADIIPIFGSIVAFGNAARKGDIEGIILATVALGALAVGITCPPCGAGIALGAALYGIGKLIYEAIVGTVTEPKPPTVADLVKDGARFEWERADQDGFIQAGPSYSVETQTVRLRTDKREFTFTRLAGSAALGQSPVDLLEGQIWYAGKKVKTNCVGGIGGVYSCAPADPKAVKVTKDKAAWIDLYYRTTPGYCDSVGQSTDCIAGGDLEVTVKAYDNKELTPEMPFYIRP
ncbi:hypothetical protein [Actinokineospora sp. NBRC 105648]|uniref:hypothetical protein n=1 Tax=Actinokineospora sp. NBRC 105648 TaxID=3032206 RepID=UPI0024A59244|nr:hypothetical protein [Actinokineospora sp. NBRC 105648]GLZ38088.1 hypothetical protein Acsp05_17120 [Actinokineospora sp. NBRC 105648]